MLSGLHASRWRRAAPLVALAALIPAFYPDRCFRTGANPGEDVLEHDAPLAGFYARSLRQGGLPLWNPHKVCGIPAVESQWIGPFHPLFWLHMALPIPWAINAGFVIHLTLTAWFAHLLCRRLGLSAAASWFAAAGWCCSSAFQQAVRDGWPGDTAAMALLPGILWLTVAAREADGRRRWLWDLGAAGLVALVVTGGHYSSGVAALGAVLLFWGPRLREPRTWGSLAIVFGGGLALSVAVWGPLVLQSSLAPAPAWARRGYALADWRNLVAPFTERRGFVGRPLLLLALLGAWRMRRPGSRQWPFLAAASWLLATCLHRPFPFDYVPVVNKIQDAWVWHLGVLLALAVWGGAGLDQLVRRRTAAAAVAAAAVVLLQLGDLYWFKQRFCPNGYAFSYAQYFADTPVVRILRRDRSLYRVLNGPLHSSALRANQPTLLGLDGFDCRIKGVNVYKLTGQGFLSGDVRFFGDRRMADLCNIKYILQDRAQPVVPVRSPAGGEGDPYEPQGMRLLGEMDAELDGRPIRVQLLENKRCLPRAFLLCGPDRRALLDATNWLRDTPLYQVRIPETLSAALERAAPAGVRRETNAYHVACRAAEDALLVVSEMYDPGWRAKLDGQPVDILSPLNFFMAVRVPAGRHAVTLEYRPAAVFACWAVSAAALALAVLAAAALAAVRPGHRSAASNG